MSDNPRAQASAAQPLAEAPPRTGPQGPVAQGPVAQGPVPQGVAAPGATRGPIPPRPVPQPVPQPTAGLRPGMAGQGPQQGGPPPGPAVNILPMASRTTMRRRHWGLLLSFVLLALLPITLVAVYLWTVAEDQYASVTGFTVRQEEGGAASELLGGLAQFAGAGGGAADSDVLYEFIQSQEIVERVDARLDLRGHFSRHWDTDKAFAIWPDATIEDLVWYWDRVVRISYDQGTGLIELRALAYDPEYARALARAIVAESQEMINALSEAARADATRYAEADLEEAVERLKAAREALTAFRTRTSIVDPEADLQGRMGVMNNLQQQLAQALIDLDLLRDTTNAADPRVTQAQRRIEVIRERILRERENLTESDGTRSAVAEDYPQLLAEYESLNVDREFAEQSYRAALTALDAARANAARQSRYLATFVEPTLAQSPEYPQRFVLTGLTALFVLLGWSIMALVYYSLRDRR